jgi:hypothetical protein
MPAIAESVFDGVSPPVGVAAWKNRERQSSLAVAAAVMSDARVLKVASVVLRLLLSGSMITLPQPPVCRFTKFGTFIAAIRRPSGFPEMAPSFINCAAVNAEATVVNSSTVTVPAGVEPSSVSSETLGALATT